MKKLAALLLVSLAIAPAGVSFSYAYPSKVCSTESREAEVPSGTQTDENGRTWVGFKAGGLPPDSLSKSSDATVCEDYID